MNEDMKTLTRCQAVKWQQLTVRHYETLNASGLLSECQIKDLFELYNQLQNRIDEIDREEEKEVC